MSNFEVMALNPTTPQLRAPGAGDGYAFNFGSLSASFNQIEINLTLNNAAVHSKGIVVNTTYTIDDSTSRIFQANFNGVEQLRITNDGSVYCKAVADINGTVGVSAFVLNTAGLTLGTSSTRRLLAASQTFYLEADNNGGTKRGFQGAVLRTIPATVGSLTSGLIALQGARGFVTDATLGIIAGLGTTVVGGGANAVPVYYNGTNWIIG